MDYLKEDASKVPGQQYVLVSWVGPDRTNQRADKYGIKIRGAFPSVEDASIHAKRLSRDDKILDIYVVEMNKWILCWPDKDITKEKSDEYLNHLMKLRMDEQKAINNAFEERKKAIESGKIDPSKDDVEEPTIEEIKDDEKKVHFAEQSSDNFLEPDYTNVPSQNFAVVSYLGKEGEAVPEENYGFKVSGCFNTQEEAAKFAKQLQKEDPIVSYFVTNMYQWLACWPSDGDVEDVHYGNEKLEELMQERRKNQAEAEKMFGNRLRAHESNVEDPTDENAKFYTKPEEPPVKHPSELVEEIKAEKPGLTMDEYVELAKERFKDEEARIAKWREENR